MNFFRSIGMAFAMFSKLPVPPVEWKEENMQYMLAAFPLVGVVIGLVLWGWSAMSRLLGFGPVLYAAGMTVWPVLITGGIHLDGFCDTVDALSSHGDAEKKIAILKDPHAGVFAVVFSCVYLLAQFALFTETEKSTPLLWLVCLIPVLSRCLSGLSAIAFRGSSAWGLLHLFKNSARKGAAVTVLLVIFLTALAIGFCIQPLVAVVMLALWLSCGVYVYAMSRRQFGGMSGDISGFLLQITELVLLLGVVLAEKGMML